MKQLSNEPNKEPGIWILWNLINGQGEEKQQSCSSQKADAGYVN